MKTFYLLAFSCILSVCYAQERKDFYKHELQLNGGINLHEVLEIEPAYSYLINKNVGFTLGLTMMGEPLYSLLYIFDPEEIYYDDYDYYDRNYNFDGDIAILLRPAIRFRFPIIKDTEGDLLALNIEPGAFLDLSPKRRHIPTSNYAYERLFFHLKTYLTLDFDNWKFSLGCGFSNFDMYKNLRDKINTVSFLASISYCF